MDTIAFRQWLSARGLSSRSVGDVCSRLKRVTEFLDISTVSSKVDLDVAFIRSPAVQSLTVSVRSQLKRAVRLWLEFREGQR